MRICTRCQRSDLSEEDFPYRSKRAGRRHSYCRHRQNSMSRAHYSANRPRYLANNRRKFERLQDRINELKRGACTDCGQVFPPCAMDFDHRLGQRKDGLVSRLVKGRQKGWRLILAEIEKCDLVCANCHRVRTHQRTGRHDVVCVRPG